jgi:hypothetical protein
MAQDLDKIIDSLKIETAEARRGAVKAEDPEAGLSDLAARVGR